MKSRKQFMKNCSKTKQNFTRAPSGERHFYCDSKNSTQSPDYTLGMAGNHGIINDKIRSKILISPTNAQTAKLSNMSSMDSHLLNYTQIPIYFNTKKSKSRKRNSNLKSSCSDKKSKNCSSSEKKQSNKKSKCCVYFSSVLSESTPRENELSPFHANSGINHYNCIARKKSQAVSIGSESRVYTPDQLNQVYEESICKYKQLSMNNSILNKSKKPKRGVKTSYGNYTQSDNTT